MDKVEIDKRILYISERLKWLKKSIEKYNSSNDSEMLYFTLKTIERECEEIVESATRINQELLEELGELGETYRDSFEKLVRLDMFKDDLDFLEKIANTTGFRNRLAHDYIDLDEKITVSSAKQMLKLYPKYLLEIKKQIKKQNR